MGWKANHLHGHQTIRRNIDGMKVTIEFARRNREQTIQALKELIDEIDVEKIAT